MAQALGIPELEASGAETGMRSRQLKRRLDGQPSKNLMAERRRRRGLNDRLSMFRSAVPRMSKMDMTSILGGTVNYTKELLARFKSLQEEVDQSEDSSDHLNLQNFLKQLERNQALVRNTPRVWFG
ncbi:Transcription factor [Nymphaea thermarum]|nr:Transcription factor [Nymphaea thermarum]